MTSVHRRLDHGSCRHDRRTSRRRKHNAIVVVQVGRAQFEIFTLEGGLLEFELAHGGHEFELLGFDGGTGEHFLWELWFFFLG